MLHHKNNFGETLLGLVLRQQGTLLVPQTILLELEKSYHGNERDVTRCFRATLQPPLEVHKALTNIEETYEKGILKKIRIWAKVLIFASLVPAFFMLFDMGTDTNLVVDYYDDYMCNTTECEAYENTTKELMTKTCEDSNEMSISFVQNNSYTCASAENISICNQVCSQGCDQFFNQTAETFYHPYYSYPDALSSKSKFFYSLTFIMIPWIAYLIEFYYSEIFLSRK